MSIENELENEEPVKPELLAEMDEAISLDLGVKPGEGEEDGEEVVAVVDDPNKKPVDETVVKPAAGAKEPTAAEKEAANKAAAAAGEEVPFPDSWGKDENLKKQWGALPKETKAQIAKREKDVLDGIGSYKERAEFSEHFKAVLQPHMQLLTQYGINPLQHVGALLGIHRTLATGQPADKVKTFRDLMGAFKITPQDLGFVEGEAPAVDPAVQALTTELGGVKSELSEQKRLQLEARRTEAAQVLDRISKDTAKYPYFTEVLGDIELLLKSGTLKATDLEGRLAEAYERSRWSNPAVRVKVLTDQAKADTEKAQKEANERAEVARQATSANLKTKVKPRGAAAPGAEATDESMDETLEHTLKDINSRTAA